MAVGFTVEMVQKEVEGAAEVEDVEMEDVVDQDSSATIVCIGLDFTLLGSQVLGRRLTVWSDADRIGSQTS